MCWLSTSVPSQSKMTNFNDLAMNSRFIPATVAGYQTAPAPAVTMRVIPTDRGAVLTMVAVAFSGFAPLTFQPGIGADKPIHGDELPTYAAPRESLLRMRGASTRSE